MGVVKWLLHPPHLDETLLNIFENHNEINWHNPASDNIFKVNNRNTRKRCEIY